MGQEIQRADRGATENNNFHKIIARKCSHFSEFELGTLVFHFRTGGIVHEPEYLTGRGGANAGGWEALLGLIEYGV